jgi:hypothetical protein
VKSAREQLDILTAYHELGSYRAAAALCGTTNDARMTRWPFSSTASPLLHQSGDVTAPRRGVRLQRPGHRAQVRRNRLTGAVAAAMKDNWFRNRKQQLGGEE